MARRTEKDITEFLGKSACDKAFSDFFIFFSVRVIVDDLSCPFLLRTEKDITSIKSFSLRAFLVHHLPGFQ